MAIFGKENTAVPPPEAVPGPGRPAGAPTVIGAKAKLVGELSGEDDLVVQGRVDGKIRGGRLVTIAPGGEVEGEVHARTAVLGGHLKGLLEATERAELQATAVLEGDVRAPKIVISEGAVLQGKIDMSSGSGAPGPRGEEKKG